MEGVTDYKSPAWGRSPLLLAIALLAGASGIVLVVRLTETLAITPWESALGMEAMRFNAGTRLYETGHATHLYGPLLSVVLGGIFALTGFNLLVARSIFFGFALALVALLTVLLCRRDLKRPWPLAALLFLAINLRTNFIFFSTQPDCLAAFFAVLALALWTVHDDSWVRISLSLALFLVAMLLKQTSAAFALIPIAHAILWKRQGWKAFALAFLPTAFLLVALVAIRLFYPAVFEGMVLVPGRLKVYYGRSVGMAIFFLGSFPVFFLGLAALLFKGQLDRRERWICSSLMVLVPVSIWTTIKSGGGYNSLLFGYLAMTALVVSQLDRLLEPIRAWSSGRNFLRASAVALVILCSFFFQFEKSVPLLLSASGDDRYEAAVQVARQVGPGVISPQDPTIAFRANKFWGRAIYFELDAHSINGDWPAALPPGMQRELDQSRFLIEVQTHVPSPLTPELLTRNGFRQLLVPQLSDSAYTLWAKAD